MAIHKLYYISSGRYNRMFTLRVHVTGETDYPRDHYIKTLARTEDKACRVAEDYVAGLVDTNYSFDPNSTPTLNSGWGGLNPAQAARQEDYLVPKLEMVAAGMWPWGKFEGQRFSEATEGYVSFLSAKLRESLEESGGRGWNDPLTEAVLEALDGQTFKADAPKPGATSEWVGEEKSRQMFSGTVIFTKWLENDGRFYNAPDRVMMKIITEDDNLIVFFGSGNLSHAHKGETVSFKATVKEHSEYNGTKQTIINRPSSVTITAAESEAA